MNNLEQKMVDTLKDLKENYAVVGIKAEFEAEGTRLDEALRLKDIISKAGLGLTIKIGGCEAIRDIYEAINIGVERIVAPMVETPYALIKYLRLIKQFKDQNIDFFINIETITSSDNFGKMISLQEIELLKGVVIGRVDMSGSLGLSRDDIESDEIFDLVKILLICAKQHGLQTVVGGGVSVYSIPFFAKLPFNCLDRFETRKVIFDYKKKKNLIEGINKAVVFELMWLENKQNYYLKIANEDNIRLGMLRKRRANAVI